MPLGPWIRGIQNVNDPAMTPKGCVVEAENVYINSDGAVVPRSGYSLVTPGGHSLFRHNNRVYGLLNSLVCEFLDNEARILWATPVVGKVTWGVLNDEPVFTNTTVLARVTPDGVKRIGVDAPVVPYSADGLRAYSFVNQDGEEGPLSPLTDTPPVVTDPSIAKVRVYEAQGDMLYLIGETGDGSAASPVSAAYGKLADTMNKARMPGGNYVRYWRGRLLVARGRTLFFSDPLRYGLYDRSSGFVPFEARIDFIEPVENGVYVALKNVGVVFLAGETPEKWERRTAAVLPAQPGASALIPTAQMKLDVQSKPEWSAVWLTEKGFALGFPSGNVLYPQADLLSGLPLGTGALHFEGDRLIALSQ